MSFRDEQRDLLQANMARDQAEHLLHELQRMARDAEAHAAERTDLNEDEKVLGKIAMEKAMASARRMVESLNAAMNIAQDAVSAGGWEELDTKREQDEGDE